MSIVNVWKVQYPHTNTNFICLHLELQSLLFAMELAITEEIV